MNEMQFTIEIEASRQTVWATLWQDATFREWAGIIDPETYMVGDLRTGSEVQFISARGGYGVTSLVEEVVENELLLLRHRADTQDEGAREREDEWTGGAERYELANKDGRTVLTVTFDVPIDMEAMFTVRYPKALARIKQLAESKQTQRERYG